MRYEIKEVEGFSDTRVFQVRKQTQYAQSTDVWVGAERNGKLIARCTQCSGPLSAMLSTCSHAKAVARKLRPPLDKG